MPGLHWNTLKKSHSYFVDFRLPAIKRKLLEAIGVSSNQIAVLILKFYDEYAAEVSRHMDYEAARASVHRADPSALQ